MLKHRIVWRSLRATAIIAATLFVVLLGPHRARAATASVNFTVRATVLASCAVAAADLDFGNYLPSDTTASTASSTIDVTCTSGTPYAVSLDGGTVSHAMAARNMSDTGGDLLSYGLYTSSACTTVWGDGTGSTANDSGTGNASMQSYTVFGQVPAGQYVPAAPYSDQISVTVSY